jgi:aminoglycoside 2'-N-acetyltransferase I
MQAQVLATPDLDERSLAAIRSLLVAAFDGGFDEHDWAHTCGGWHIVIEDGGHLVAHAAVVARILDVDGTLLRTGYVEGVATAPDRQGSGLGTAVMQAAATVIERDFDLGALSTGEHTFYERLGWERWQGPTFATHGTERARTPDDDDGVMVRRFGPTAELPLDGEITCEGRPGDDW